MFQEVDHISTVRELIELRAQSQPAASFLIEAETGRVLTFGQLEQQSIVLSNQLREAGLERGDKVAFLMDNGLSVTMNGKYVSEIIWIE